MARGPEELAKVWQDFLTEKFSPTQNEKLRAEFDALSDNNEEDTQITREEFEDAVSIVYAEGKINRAGQHTSRSLSKLNGGARGAF